MAILDNEREAVDQEVSLHEEDVGYKETTKDSQWYLDNGASNHITGMRDHFENLDEKVSGRVKFGDGSYIEIKGKEDITPYEAIKGKKPNLKDLRVFGCIAYAKVPSQHLTKLDDRSIKLVYLGNEHGSKAYRLFDPTTQRICVSRDVKFKENEKWDWSKYLDSPTEILHTPLTSSPQINSQRSPNQSDEVIAATIETQSYFDHTPIRETQSYFDHTPIRGYRTLTDIYENTEELLLAEDEPKNYKEASNDQKWIEAMKDELDSINRNNTWRLTSLPPGHKAIGLKWVFKTKKDKDGKIINYKARLVAKGYIKEHGIDFEKVFAPVARMETIRKDNGKVYRLIKALYGLRQAPRAWNIKLDNTLKSLEFKKCTLEQAIYKRTGKDSILLVGVYVDDLIITGTPKREID
nr:hypothetical protein [Tanacetum cinerariifolium]